ncbi:MAG: prepilin-type N-terminal cleavage/methylation domain-containing protein [Desulfobulbaceae bacterium]|nr:prepilin-type N-terminal cleavage/methylation domain-containing protein [Desulfobulbaceae bacterium]
MNPIARKGLGRQGFSLFEMLLVMALLGVMATMAGLAMGPLLEKVKFRRQTEKYTAFLRYARLLAITSGKPTRLELGGDGDDCTFLFSGAVEEKRACELEDKDVLVLDPGVLTFFPEGSATPGVLTFSREKRKATIRLDLLTGRPELE